MVRRKDNEREKARHLRQQGQSYKQISQILGVSKSSAYSWCKDIELTSEQKTINKQRGIQYGSDNTGAQTNKEKALAKRKIWQDAGRKKATENIRLHLMGCMLYWAEGTKSDRNKVEFANSDIDMILLFIKFLTDELDIPHSKIKVQIHCHEKDAEKRQNIEDYWLNLIGVTRDNLYKTQVVKSSGRSTNILQYGVCSVSVNSTEVLQHIFGAIQEYGGFENEDWLF